MQKIKQEVKEFLKQYSMSYEEIDIEENCKLFVEEMEKGLKGEASSLQMIPTYISLGEKVPFNEPVIVLDAGGTNFRVAGCYFDEEKGPIIENYKSYPMPGVERETSKKEFFETIVNFMKPLLNYSKKIGFCFSYPTEALPNKDGKVLQFSKEIKLSELIGEAVGEGLLKALKDAGFSDDKEIVVLNDTVATLLGGKATYPDRLFSSYVGFILGTGTNTCYVEQNKNIKKLPDIQNKLGSMIINIESGGYAKAPQGVIDKEFDLQTANPGSYTFEKMISGRYQGGLISAVVKKAAEDKLVTKEFSDRFDKIGEITAVDINDFLYYPYSKSLLSTCCLEDSNDAIVLYHLIDAIIERAAKLTAINLSAILSKTGDGTNPCKPVCITCEGSTFYKSKLFKDKLVYYMKDYLNDKKDMYFEFVRADNSTLIGAAIAGLMN